MAHFGCADIENPLSHGRRRDNLTASKPTGESRYRLPVVKGKMEQTAQTIALTFRRNVRRSFTGCCLAVTFAVLMPSAHTLLATPPVASHSQSIPMDQLGAVAGKQYQGDGLSVSATPDGARLRCAFQRLEGQVTREGLWLRSAADGSAGEGLRVRAVAVGRADGFGFRSVAVPGHRDVNTTDSHEQSASTFLSTLLRPGTGALRDVGVVEVADKLVRFIRDGLTEEYSVNVDGVRQDFIVKQRPAGEGELRVELEITGATAEPHGNGARLTLNGSGRKLAYHRLRVVDATGHELPARIEIGNARVAQGGARLLTSRLAGTLAPLADTPGLAVVVDDTTAVYPMRIDPTFSDADWSSLGGVCGANGNVYAMAVDNSGRLYIGGNFITAGGITANYVASWDGSTWASLGSGMNGIVNALAISGPDVYVGGSFNTAGGVTVNYIAKWNGSAWSPLGSGMNGSVSALAISGSDLYAGGTFTLAGGNAVNNIAKWDGNAWTPLGTGTSDTVYALAISGSDLYAGGLFATAGGITANYIAKWNGNAWSALGFGMDGYVRALTVSGSDLYVGGHFTIATNVNGEAVTVNRVAKWNGTTWFSLGSALNDHVYALAVSGSDLYVGGQFVAGGSGASYVAKWNGSTWSALGPAIDAGVFALTVAGTDLYAGGGFSRAGGGSADYVAKWNGSVWLALGSGLSDKIMALAVSGTNLYVGGYFTTAGGAAANRIAKWDGSAWVALGSGMNNAVNALAILGTNLYAGGSFTKAGGVTVNYIAKWNGSAWSALSSGMNNSVYVLAVSGTNLFVGGLFTTAGITTSANRIAKWNGSAWSALGSGMNNSVNAIAVSGTNVYAGGVFTTAGGTAANRIAKWDGSGWSALGSGMNNSITALAVTSTDLYAGGWFTTAGGTAASRVAKWDGSAWLSLGSGISSTVYALVVSGTDLYVGGEFFMAGGTSTKRIAKWDGSAWSALGSGINDSVYALVVWGANLYAGGDFTTAGNVVSAYAAKARVGVGSGRFTNTGSSTPTGFRCTFLDATVGQPYRIQTSHSLAAGSWIDFTNFTYTAPTVITDADAGSGTNKFFRAVTP